MRLILLTTALTVVLGFVAVARVPDSVAEDYPGRGQGTTVHVIAPRLIQEALIAYYMVHGQWPRWEQLTGEGWLQVKLVTFSGREINPGDGGINFAQDIFYEYRGDRFPPVLHYRMDLPGGMTAKRITPGTPKTWREALTAAARVSPENGAAGFVDDPGYHKLRSVQLVLSNGVGSFNQVKGRAPRDLAELLDSGLCCFGRGAVNPVNGKPFVTTDTRGVFYYEPIRDGDVLRFRLYFVDDHGRRVSNGGFIY